MAAASHRVGQTHQQGPRLNDDIEAGSLLIGGL